MPTAMVATVRALRRGFRVTVAAAKRHIGPASKRNADTSGERPRCTTNRAPAANATATSAVASKPQVAEPVACCITRAPTTHPTRRANVRPHTKGAQDADLPGALLEHVGEPVEADEKCGVQACQSEGGSQQRRERLHELLQVRLALLGGFHQKPRRHHRGDALLDGAQLAVA